MNRWSHVLSVPVILALLPPGAAGAPLGPTKPSQLVVVGSRATHPCDLADTGGSRVDVFEADDGSTQPFTIPPGKVLIVTKIKVSARGRSVPSGTEVLATIVKNVGGVAYLYGTLDQNKLAVMTEEYPSGLRVKSGQPMCLTVYTVPADDSIEVVDITFTSGVSLYGFITADR